MLIAECLRDCGYQVIEATLEKDVWTILEAERRVDIVLADVRLGGATDGFSAFPCG